MTSLHFDPGDSFVLESKGEWKQNLVENKNEYLIKKTLEYINKEWSESYLAFC